MIMHRLFNGGWRIVTRVVLRGVNVDKRTSLLLLLINIAASCYQLKTIYNTCSCDSSAEMFLFAFSKGIIRFLTEDGAMVKVVIFANIL